MANTNTSNQVLMTAETITAEQISALWTDLTRHESAGVPIHGVLQCIVALGLPDDPPTDAERYAARAVCAEILNARATGAKLMCRRCSGLVHRSWDHLDVSENGERWTCFTGARGI